MKGYEGFYTDLWSLGVLLYAMLCASVPFKAQSMKELQVILNKGEFSYPCKIDKGLIIRCQRFDWFIT